MDKITATCDELTDEPSMTEVEVLASICRMLDEQNNSAANRIIAWLVDRHDEIYDRSPANLTKGFKNQRRDKILSVASTLATHGTFITDDIVNELKKQNFDMRIPKNRINTAIGTMMSRSGLYEMPAAGVFRIKEKELNDVDTK